MPRQNKVNPFGEFEKGVEKGVRRRQKGQPLTLDKRKTTNVPSLGLTPSFHLVTQSDRESCEKQADHLNQLVTSFTGSRIAFTWELDHNPNFHARSITTDTGWKITIDRGLDIFQKYETGAFSLEQAVQEARLTRGAEVTYLKIEL